MAGAGRLDRILILGGTGMLGHRLVQAGSQRGETWTTTRRSWNDLESFGFYDESRTITEIDAMNLDAVCGVIRDLKPTAVVNCIGIIKQQSLAKDPIASLTINALLPHVAAKASAGVGAKFIHVSTDCVFDGRRGSYREDDLTNAEDLYGRSKAMGEVTDHGALTLRTSIIGHELEAKFGLLEWFLKGHRQVRGFTKALFTGFTTNELSRVILDTLENHDNLTGLYQVASEPISKFELLKLFRDAFGTNTLILPECEIVIDRTLDGSRFQLATGYSAPSWPEMIDELARHHQPTQSRDYYAIAG